MQRPFNPLLSALPSVIRVSDARRRRHRRVRAVRNRRVEAAAASGGECVLGRLSELMFVDVVRQYLETLPADRPGWLAGLREPFVGRALAALHRESRARTGRSSRWRTRVGLSRSALAERFTHARRAAADAVPHELADAAGRQPSAGGADSVAAIAGRVGYESEAAFSRAFKKAVGAPPSQWRTRQDDGASSGRTKRLASPESMS